MLQYIEFKEWQNEIIRTKNYYLQDCKECKKYYKTTESKEYKFIKNARI